MTVTLGLRSLARWTRRWPVRRRRWHQNHIHVGQILKDLIGNGALPGGDGRVVEGVDVGEPLLLRQLGGQLRRVVEGLAVEHHLGPVVLRVVDLHQRGCSGMTMVADTPAAWAA